MNKMTRRALGAAGLAFMLATSTAWAQQGPPVRIRGQIQNVDGDMLTIKARDGSEVKVKLADNARVIAQVKASLADVKTGAYVGVTGMPQPDGSQRAIAIHIFLEAQRNVVPDRFGPWDLREGSTMTNATVETTVTSTNGQEIMVKYKDGEKKIIVSPETPIVANTPGEKSEIKPGAQIIIMGAQKQPDGSLTTNGIYVGRGVTPPM
jgi:outer membrane lipoprotein SlyB